MIFDQIFCWASQIHWIPIQERFSNFIQLVLRYSFCCVFLTQQNEIPEIRSNVFMSDTQNTNFRTIQVSLKQVSKSVESKVNGWVWKGFNQVLLIEWELGTKTEWSRATPFFKPVDGVNQIIMKSFTVALELSFNVVQDFLLPFLMTIVDVPLFTVSNDTFVSRSWDNLSSWLEIFQGLIWVDKIFSDQILGISNFLTLIISD